MKMMAFFGVVLLMTLAQVKAETYPAESVSADFIDSQKCPFCDDTVRIVKGGKTLFSATSDKAEVIAKIANLKLEQARESKLPVEIGKADLSARTEDLRMLSRILTPYTTLSGEIKYSSDLHLEAYRIRIRPNRGLIDLKGHRYDVLIDHEELLTISFCAKDKGLTAKFMVKKMEEVLKDANIIGNRVRIDLDALAGGKCVDVDANPFSVSTFVE